MSFANRVQKLAPGGGVATVLTVAAFAESLALGVFLTAGPLYFVRVVGLPVAHVGAAITVAGLVGLLAGVPAGWWADRRGARTVVLPAMVLQAAGLACYLLVHTVVLYAVVAALVVIGERAAYAARGAVMSYAFEGTERVRVRAYLRATNNAALAVGTLLGGVAVSVDSPTAYRVALLSASAALLAAAAASAKLPNLRRPEPTDGAPERSVLKDGPYAVVATANGLMSMHYAMVEIAMPIWVVQNTRAPSWLVMVLFLLNTAAVIVFQVRLTRGIDSPDAAASAQRQSGFLLLGSAVLFAVAASVGAVAACVVLVGAVAVHVIAEMRQMAGSWTLAFDLAPAHAQGAYQGSYNTFAQAGAIAAPAVVLALTSAFGAVGWVVLGVWFAILGTGFPRVVRWAQGRTGAGLPPVETPAVATS